jgi:transglutaminase-like putative cysteine protease
MTSRRHMTLVAAACTLLASAPIISIFDSLKWLMQSVIVVAVIMGAAWGARSLRMRVWAQVLAMILGLLVGVTMFNGDGTALAGLIPTPATFAHFATLFTQSGVEVRSAYVPAPDLPGLLFITVLGVGSVAILVDLFAVGLRRPALAGLPMLAIYSVPVAVYVESVSPVPFMIGAAGYMWLLVSDNVDKVRRFGRRFTGEGRGVDLWEPSPLAAAGRRLAVAGVLAAVILPIAVPGMTAGLFTDWGASGQGGQGPGGNGPGSAVNLFAYLGGQLNESAVRELVRVTTNDPNPFYMRFGTADDIQLDGFRNRGPNGQPVGSDLPKPLALGAPGVTNQQFSAKVDVFKTFDMPLLPVYSAPVSTRGLDANWRYDPDQQVIYSQRLKSSGRKYEFDYVRSDFSPDALRTAKQLPLANPVQRTYTRLPIELPEVRTLVDSLTKDKATEYDRVRALYDYFSQKNGFVYDLTVPEGSSGQKITDFLEQKRGFCQQYAAALAWMARAAGIPSRVAFGFTRGSNYTGGVYTLTNHNLHAWTEIYFDGFGWVPFDATPSASVAGAVNSVWAPNVDAPTTSPTSGGPQATATPDGSDTEKVRSTTDPSCPDATARSWVAATPPRRRRAWVFWASGGAVVVPRAVSASLAAATHAPPRRRRLSVAESTVSAATTEDNVIVVDVSDADAARRKAHVAWDELMDTMVDYRIPIDAAETPRTTAERLIRTEGLPTSPAESARRIGQAEERARYSRQPISPDGLMEAVADVRQTLAGQAGRWVRLSAIILPPSVTQRWRAAMSAAATAAANRMTDINLAMRNMMRPLRLRRLPR